MVAGMKIQYSFLIGVCLCMLTWTSGCTGIGFGDVHYADGNLQVTVENPSGTVNGTVQVTVFAIRDFKQTEVAKIARSESLPTGMTTLTFPMDLSPGDYKIYTYFMKGNERTVSMIKDIRV
jgi:hypothetical protein